MNYLMNKVKGFVVEEDGIGTVEMILILVVLIGLVLIFKDNLNQLVESLFKTIKAQAGRV
ncbi:Putative Flagellin, Flp1-like, domain [Pseudobutyrivibrio sp. YE44]|uniref:Flp1 family type IVb pilin n=1 Tax=Pseudobutyrivibrio sp. YE44 TaxID=1520802 RepID=UPI00088669B6|nr:Flp1 family type IVb pilin [Pseudobutyrivibrio sp. YE44]SDB37257.1 Putative Flagellin, Flp1-like, domain [Pseudobutyrivibrio sp. YE44]